MRVRDAARPPHPVLQVPARRGPLLELLRQPTTWSLPVVKTDSPKLVGVVTRRDVLANPDEDQVSLLMNPNPTTTYAQATVEEASALLVQHGLDLLCIVSGSNEVLGTVSPADVLRVQRVPRATIPTRPARSAVPIHHATPATVAVEILRATGAPCLLMLDDDGRYAGLVHDGHILAKAHVEDHKETGSPHAREGDAWSWETNAAHGVHRRVSRLVVPRDPLSSLAVRGLPVLPPAASLEAAVKLVMEGHRRIPIIDADRRVRDALTDIDVLRACMAARA